jgi:hypothetical protein
MPILQMSWLFVRTSTNRCGLEFASPGQAFLERLMDAAIKNRPAISKTLP